MKPRPQTGIDRNNNKFGRNKTVGKRNLNESMLRSITLDQSDHKMTIDQRIMSSNKVKIVGNLIGNYFHATDDKIAKKESNIDLKPLSRKQEREMRIE